LAFRAGAIYGEAILDTFKWSSGLKGLTTTSKIAIAAIGAVFVAGMVKVTKAADEFQRAMSNVATLVDTSVISIKDLEKQILRLDPALGSTTELTEGLYQAFSAGAETAEEAMQITSDSAMFAKAALTDTNTAVNVLTTAINAYGKENMTANQAADIFFTTIKKGKITGEELAASIGTSIPLYASAGIKLEELASGIAAMTKQGVSANVATTQLNAIVSAFLKPSEDMIAALQNMGHESGSAFLAAEGLAGALELIETQTSGDAAAMADLLPNIRALRGAMALTGAGGKTFGETLDEMETAAGATKIAFDKQEKTFDTLKNSMDRIQIVVGEVGRLMAVDLAEGLTKAATWFTNLDDATMSIIKDFLKATIVVGGVAAAIYGVTVAVGALSTAFAFLAANPAVAVLIGIAAVTTAVIALTAKAHRDNMEKLTEKFGGLAEATGVAENEMNKFVKSAQRVEDVLEFIREVPFERAVRAIDRLTESMNLTRKQVVEIGLASDDISDSMRESLKIIKEEIDRQKELREIVIAMKETRNKILELRGTSLGLAERERKKQLEITKQIIEQTKSEEERIAWVIKERLAATKVYEVSLRESFVKTNLGLIDERENLQMNTQAAETFLNSLIAIGYDGADAIWTGDQQLLETIGTLEELRAQLEKMEPTISDIGGYIENLAGQIEEAWTGVWYTTGEIETEGIEKSKVKLQDYFSAISSGVSHFYSGLTAISSQYYTNLRAEMDLQHQADLVALDLKLQNEVITQEEYDALRKTLEEKQLEEKNALAEKAFKAEKINRKAGIWIDTASAIQGWWSAAAKLGPIFGPIFGAGMSIATIALAAKQISLINKQKFVPSKKRGGPASGMTRINERGGEIINLPDNSLVIPADISRQIAMAGGSSSPIINVSFAGAKISDEMDLERVTDRVIRKLGKEMRLAI